MTHHINTYTPSFATHLLNTNTHLFSASRYTYPLKAIYLLNTCIPLYSDTLLTPLNTHAHALLYIHSCTQSLYVLIPSTHPITTPYHHTLSSYPINTSSTRYDRMREITTSLYCPLVTFSVPFEGRYAANVKEFGKEEYLKANPRHQTGA